MVYICASKGVIIIVQMNTSSSSSQRKPSEPSGSMSAPQSEGLALMPVERLAMNTKHQHKENYSSSLRADFCHRYFNQVTSEDTCLTALAVSQVCGRYSIQIYRALCHCSVHFSHFIFLYIILYTYSKASAVYDASCILRKKIMNCNFRKKTRKRQEEKYLQRK